MTSARYLPWYPRGKHGATWSGGQLCGLGSYTQRMTIRGEMSEGGGLLGDATCFLLNSLLQYFYQWFRGCLKKRSTNLWVTWNRDPNDLHRFWQRAKSNKINSCLISWNLTLPTLRQKKKKKIDNISAEEERHHLAAPFSWQKAQYVHSVLCLSDKQKPQTDALWGPISRGTAHTKLPAPPTKLRQVPGSTLRGEWTRLLKGFWGIFAGICNVKEDLGDGREMERCESPLWISEWGIRLCQFCSVHPKASNYNRCITSVKCRHIWAQPK